MAVHAAGRQADNVLERICQITMRSVELRYDDDDVAHILPTALKNRRKILLG